MITYLIVPIILSVYIAFLQDKRARTLQGFDDELFSDDT